MTDEQIKEKAFKLHPVSLSTYNEEAVDVNESSRNAYIAKQKIIQKALKEEKKEKEQERSIMGTLIIIRNIMLYIFVSIIIHQFDSHLSHDIVPKEVYVVSHIVWLIFIVTKMMVDFKHER